MLTVDEIDEMVARGAAKLDTFCKNWRKHVNISRLSMRSWCQCVAGQVGKPLGLDFSMVMRGMGLSSSEMDACGFCNHTMTFSDVDIRLITEAWIREILHGGRSHVSQ